MPERWSVFKAPFPSSPFPSNTMSTSDGKPRCPAHPLTLQQTWPVSAWALPTQPGRWTEGVRPQAPSSGCTFVFSHPPPCCAAALEGGSAFPLGGSLGNSCR